MRDRVSGPKKKTTDTVVIIDPLTGFPVDSPERIREVSLEYCVCLLTNREPKEGFREKILEKKRLHKERMEEVIADEEGELSSIQFAEALKKVSKNHGDKYKFILRSGPSLQNAIYRLMCIVWNQEKIPDMWHDSELIQCFKGKGSENDLNNMRHLHLKHEIPKLFEQIVIGAARERIFSNMSKFQIATKPGHRASEHVYCAMSLIALTEKNGNALFITLVDLSKYFDPEALEDCMYEL